MHLHLVQAGLVLHSFFLSNIVLRQFEIQHHFSKLGNNFRFNVIRYRQSVAALIFYRTLAVNRSLSCHHSCVWIDYIGDRYIHIACVASSSVALAFLTDMNEKYLII